VALAGGDDVVLRLRAKLAEQTFLDEAMTESP